MTEITKRTYKIDLTSNKESRSISGHAAIYNSYSNQLGWFKEIIMPGAFANVLEDDVRALLNHDANHLLARTASGTLKIFEDDKGLGFEFNMPESRSDIIEMIERGDLSQNSFAFTVKRDAWHEDDEGNTTRTILEVDRLFDISLVTYPAYEGTDLAVRSYEVWKKTNEEKKTFPASHKNQIRNADIRTMELKGLIN